MRFLGPGNCPRQAGRSVTDYLQDHPRLAGADKNNVMVITPEGETVVAPVALWNKKTCGTTARQPALVGLFLRMYCPKKYADLNDQIVSVLTQRVPD
ncbi:capsule biosynthesis GfcC family protein [Escherichia coli]